jgi:hypothetical protein
MYNQACAGVHSQEASVRSERRFGVHVQRVGTLLSAEHKWVNLMPLKRYPARSQIKYTLRISRESGLPSVGIPFLRTFVDQLLTAILLSSSVSTCVSGHCRYATAIRGQ